jgi:hypothetical protein
MSSSTTEAPAIRAVRAGDESIVRDVCVQMLLDTPEPFGETLAIAIAVIVRTLRYKLSYWLSDSNNEEV